MLSFSVVAQQTQPKPTPSPTPTDPDVVKISTSLIQLDVTIVDEKGKVVTDVRPDEIEIFENGEKQKITNLSFVASGKTIPEKKESATVKNEIPIPQQTLRPEQVRRTIALVVDDLSLSFESAYQTRRALTKFVDEQMQEGDLVAIIRTGAGIGALQQFTSDKNILAAAIERVRWNPIGNGGLSAFAPLQPTFAEMTAAAGGTLDQSEGGNAANTQKSFESFQTSTFATGTLGALRFIVEGMSELPGRKSVILFSDGFGIFEQDEHGFTQSGSVEEFLKILVDKANRASVVFYTIDARGLQYTGFTAADKIPVDPRAFSAKLSERAGQLFDTQAGLSYLADETGGLAFKNNNDLVSGVRKSLEDQSYYLIAYEPDSDTFDAQKRKFNKIEVKVTRKGLTARYRSGFFNVAEKTDKEKSNAIPKKQTPAMQLQTALMSPFAVNSISLRMNALFGHNAVGGTYVRSLLHIQAKDLKFTEEKDGTKKAEFEVWAASFGDNGGVVDQIVKKYTLNVKAEGYKKVIDDGFVYYFTFPVKKPGAYQYRVAIRDTQSEKIGSASQFIQIPDVKKGLLATSGIVLENLSKDEWAKLVDPNGGMVQSSSSSDTALRRIKPGTILRYGCEIYNAKLDAGKRPNLTTRIRIFRDGKLILDGQQIPYDLAKQTDMQRLQLEGALDLTDNMTPGDYILQIIITDNIAKAKQQNSTRYVEFEITN